jgi:hypothetical protein
MRIHKDPLVGYYSNVNREVIMKLKRMVTLSIFLAIVMVVGFGCATTPKETVPVKAEEAQDWRFHDVVEVEFVKQHVTIPMSQEVMLIDSRPKRSKYDKGHIPMALSIPDSQFEKMVDKLPKDKDTLLISYCEGLK